MLRDPMMMVPVMHSSCQCDCAHRCRPLDNRYSSDNQLTALRAGLFDTNTALEQLYVDKRRRGWRRNGVVGAENASEGGLGIRANRCVMARNGKVVEVRASRTPIFLSSENEVYMRSSCQCCDLAVSLTIGILTVIV